MTVDELTRIFDAAVAASAERNREELPASAHRRAGVSAIVRALRDEFADAALQGAADFERYGSLAPWDIADIVIKQILGETPGTAAGGPLGIVSGDTPNDLTNGREAPAAPSCEWTREFHPDDGSHFETACGDGWCSVLGGTPKQDNYSFCPSCGKPISFTEQSR